MMLHKKHHAVRSGFTRTQLGHILINPRRGHINYKEDSHGMSYLPLCVFPREGFVASTHVPAFAIYLWGCSFKNITPL